MEEQLYNLNIERAIINSIIFESSQFDDISETLKFNDFYLPAHQEIFRAMEQLHKKELPLDEEFIKKELHGGKFDENAMLEILSVNPISNTGAYVKEIKDI